MARPSQAIGVKIMPLQIATGRASLTGRREENEDYCGIAAPSGLELENKGAIVAIADGVGLAKGGKLAAQYTVRGLLNDYFATPETWSIPHAIEKVTSALNRWVIAEGNRRAEQSGMATTLSVLVLRGRRYYTAHIGDTRIYRLRDGVLSQLTVDHLWDHPEHRNVLSRAIGLDPRASLDYSDGELAVGDRFLLASGGIWRVLSDAVLSEQLLSQPDAQAAAAALSSLALSRGGEANASALIVDVQALPPENMRDSLAAAANLPIPPRFSPGQEIDGLRIESILSERAAVIEYRVCQLRNQQTLVLKTLTPSMAGDQAAINALLMEEWRRRRVIGPNFSLVVPAEARTALYYLSVWQPGATLAERLEAGLQLSMGEIVRLGMNLLKALSSLHRLDWVHGDVGAASVHLGQDSVLRLLHLEQVRAFGEGDSGAGLVAWSHPADRAPECFAAAKAAAEQDLYGVGLLLYRLLTGDRHPYGAQDSLAEPDFNQPCTPPTRWRKDIPLWLESVLLKALARDPKDRFETAEEFVLALERGPSRPVNYGKQALIRRNPVLFWKSLAGCSLVLNLMLFMAYSR